ALSSQKSDIVIASNCSELLRTDSYEYRARLLQGDLKKHQSSASQHIYKDLNTKSFVHPKSEVNGHTARDEHKNTIHGRGNGIFCVSK
ncbi:MAG: hypothetical protein ACI9DJ_002767, partial [Algoriphagus sp.]